jgi:hypothetical protein
MTPPRGLAPLLSWASWLRDCLVVGPLPLQCSLKIGIRLIRELLLGTRSGLFASEQRFAFGPSGPGVHRCSVQMTGARGARAGIETELRRKRRSYRPACTMPTEALAGS